MKKVINLMAVAAVLSLAFVSCDKKKDNNDVNAEVYDVTEKQDTIPVEVVEQNGDTVTTQEDTVVVNEITETPAN